MAFCTRSAEEEEEWANEEAILILIATMAAAFRSVSSVAPIRPSVF